MQPFKNYEEIVDRSKSLRCDCNQLYSLGLVFAIFFRINDGCMEIGVLKVTSNRCSLKKKRENDVVGPNFGRIDVFSLDVLSIFILIIFKYIIIAKNIILN